MYLTKQNTDALNTIIAELNRLDDEQEQKEFLAAHVEDPVQLVEVLKSLNKKKLPGRHRRQHIEKQPIRVYEAAQLDEIFAQKDDETILREYSMADLQSMYYSAYRRNAASGRRKEDIVKTLRRRFFDSKRGEAFAHLANQRK